MCVCAHTHTPRGRGGGRGTVPAAGRSCTTCCRSPVHGRNSGAWATRNRRPPPPKRTPRAKHGARAAPARPAAYGGLVRGLHGPREEGCRDERQHRAAAAHRICRGRCPSGGRGQTAAPARTWGPQSQPAAYKYGSRRRQRALALGAAPKAVRARRHWAPGAHSARPCAPPAHQRRGRFL